MNFSCRSSTLHVFSLFSFRFATKLRRDMQLGIWGARDSSDSRRRCHGRQEWKARNTTGMQKNAENAENNHIRRMASFSDLVFLSLLALLASWPVRLGSSYAPIFDLAWPRAWLGAEQPAAVDGGSPVVGHRRSSVAIGGWRLPSYLLFLPLFTILFPCGTITCASPNTLVLLLGCGLACEARGGQGHV